MNNEVSTIKDFNFNGNDITAIRVNGKTWFFGRQVAKFLCYKRPSKAVATHIRENHRKTLTWRDSSKMEHLKFWNGNDHTDKTLIDYPGVYSLVLRSKLPQAEAFQDWITDEVIPSIQETGGYQMEQKQPQLPQTPEELLNLTVTVANRTATGLKDLRNDFEDFKQNQPIETTSYGSLNTYIGKKVYSIGKLRFGNVSNDQKKLLYKDIGDGIKRVANVRSRNLIKKTDLDKVYDFVDMWQPSTATIVQIKELGQQTELNI